jgi:hypothetical protein
MSALWPVIIQIIGFLFSFAGAKKATADAFVKTLENSFKKASRPLQMYKANRAQKKDLIKKHKDAFGDKSERT